MASVKEIQIVTEREEGRRKDNRVTLSINVTWARQIKLTKW